MKKNKDEEEVEEIEEVPEEPKKGKRESVEKRKKAKKRDAIGRYSGLIFLVLILIVGLLLWVGGEIGGEPKEMQIPGGSSYRSNPPAVNYPPSPKVIVE